MPSKRSECQEELPLFGIDGLQREMILPMKVNQGLLGTYVICNGGSCWVVLSQEAVALEELKLWIEKKDAPKKRVKEDIL